MPKKRTKTTTRTPETTVETEEDVGLSDDISAVLAELGSDGATIALYRRADVIGSRSPRYAYLVRYDSTELVPGEFMETVKTDWGGGRYQARIFVDGKSRPSKMKDFTIDSTFDSPHKTLAGHSAPDHQVAELVRELRRDMEDMRRDRDRPDTNSMEEALKIATLLQTNSQSMFTMMAEVMKGGQQKGGGMSEAMGMVKEALSLAGEIRGGGEETEAYPFEGVIKNFGAPLLQKLGEIAKEERTRPPGAPPLIAPPLAMNAPPAPPTAEPTHQVQNEGWTMTLTPWIGQLVALAQADRDQSVYAAVIVDALTEEQFDVVAQASHPDNAARYREEFYTAFVQAQQYRPWFEVLFDELGALTLEEEPVVEPSIEVPPAVEVGEAKKPAEDAAE